MKIGIDARLYSASGIGRYLRNLISNLQKIDHRNEYYIFINNKDYDNLVMANNFKKVNTNISWYSFSEQLKFPKILNKYKLDLVHFPHFNAPIFYQGKFIVTIHDLIHQHYQTKKATTHNLLFYRFKTVGYKLVFSKALFRSQKIIVPSNFVKNQLIEEWKVPENKITVTYEAVEDNFVKIAQKNNLLVWQNLQEKHHIKKPYLFYIGNAHPHKNLNRLLKTFEKLSNQYPNLQLVLSGPDSWFWQKYQKENKNKQVIFTGFISDNELITLYKNAQAFIMSSLEEGFGLPILEAMACGIPVISSYAGSLKEIGGDAALYFNPQDENEMIEKISKLLEDKKLQNELIKKGKERYQKYSWKKLAEQTLQVYQKALN